MSTGFVALGSGLRRVRPRFGRLRSTRPKRSCSEAVLYVFGFVPDVPGEPPPETPPVEVAPLGAPPPEAPSAAPPSEAEVDAEASAGPFPEACAVPDVVAPLPPCCSKGLCLGRGPRPRPLLAKVATAVSEAG